MPPPPAQIPACGFSAPGSCRRSDAIGLRGLGGPCSSDPWARASGTCLFRRCVRGMRCTCPSFDRPPSLHPLRHPPVSRCCSRLHRYYTAVRLLIPSDPASAPHLSEPARDRRGDCGRHESSSAGELHPCDRVTGSGRPPPVPTERGVRFLLRCTFGVPHHALRQVVYSTFAAIRSRSVSMVSLILSLHRGLSLPLHGAHVAPERVTCRRPLPPVNGSPVLRVLSAGLTSARPLDRPCLGGLSGYSLRLNRTDLPCSRQVLRLHASGTNPGSVPAHSPYRGTEMQPSP